MRLALAFAVGLALSGCSDDENDKDAASEAEALCEQWCALVDAAMCENSDTECLAGCMHNAVPCLPEARAFLDCLPTLVCNQDGRPMPTNCQTEFMAYGDCAPG